MTMCDHTFLLAKRSASKKKSRIEQDPLVFTLWTRGQKLNMEQSDSLFTAIKNKFQLIQGPPGD